MTEMTDTEPAMAIATDVVEVPRRPRRVPRPSFRRTAGGIAAIGVKELRGRMRGRRAFVILTIYLLLLGGFAWMVEVLLEHSFTSGFGNSAAYASASIGQGIFAALMLLETLQVVFLAPAATAGGISLEREKQTLDLLVATPISSFAIVVGKLLSALIYVFVLIAASVPLTAVVFLYGGVGPDDVVRGYLVLFMTAIGLGSFGLFCSSLVKRTQAATAISIFGVLSISIGSLFLIVFWYGVAGRGDAQGLGPIRGQPPEILAWINPFMAQADVLCGTDTTLGATCSLVSIVLPNNGVIVQDNTNGANFGGGGVAVPIPAGPVVIGKGGAIINNNVIVNDTGGGVGAAPDGVPFGTVGGSLWPKMVATWSVLSVLFLALSVQLVSPTRRWRPNLRRRAAKGIAA